MRMLSLSLSSTRNVTLSHVGGSGLDRTFIDWISLSNPAVDISSTYLAYRPNYNDFHGSGLAGMFINTGAIFPCAPNVSPICRIFTKEEDGFNKGHVFIESGDGGNNFQIFSTSTYMPTYGFAIKGCTQMDPTCLPVSYTFFIICFLPREQCS